MPESTSFHTDGEMKQGLKINLTFSGKISFGMPGKDPGNICHVSDILEQSVFYLIRKRHKDLL